MKLIPVDALALASVSLGFAPAAFAANRLSQLAVKHPSNGRISGGVVPQGRHHRMDGDYAIGMPSVVILGGGWSGKLILSR